AVVQRVVLDMDGQALLAGHQARPLGDGPALEDAIHLQAQVVVQAACRVLLDQIGIAAGRPGALAARLRRRLEVALLAIAVEAHQLALRRVCVSALPRLAGRAFLRVSPPAPALRRRASMRSTTFVSFGRLGALISRPSIFAFT